VPPTLYTVPGGGRGADLFCIISKSVQRDSDTLIRQIRVQNPFIFRILSRLNRIRDTVQRW
jgi:hypothetical protein